MLTTEMPHQFKVLLVEDERICQLVQTSILEGQGCQVDVAPNGTAALAMFNNSYDAVVLDFNLPDMKGVDVSRALRTSSVGKVVPIIGLTSEAEQRRAECLAAGYNTVLAKPANSEEIGDALKQCLRSED